MSFKERYQTLKEEAARTHGFTHNRVVRKLYAQLNNAVEAKNVDLVKNLIIRMGF